LIIAANKKQISIKKTTLPILNHLILLTQMKSYRVDSINRKGKLLKNCGKKTGKKISVEIIFSFYLQKKT